MPGPLPLPAPARSAAALALVAVLAAACGGATAKAPGSGASPSAPGVSSSGHAPATRPAGSARVVASLEPWHLGAPVSRPVVLSDGVDLVVLGGLDSAGTSASGVFCIDPATGAANQVASLTQPTHDAGGAVLGGVDLVVGGGASSVYDTVQGVRLGQSGCTSATGSPSQAVQVGTLPQPRADLSVATSGATASGATASEATTAYVAGGYDGTTLDPDVLDSADGRTWRVVGRLAQPVRYAAVAVVGQALYVLGGQPSALASGAATDAIQRVDLRTGGAAVVGRLPQPLAHAEAIVLGGRVLVLGGRVGTQASDAVLRFDPKSGTAAQVATLPEAVSDAGATVAGGVGYLVGGEASSALDTVVRIELR